MSADLVLATTITYHAVDSTPVVTMFLLMPIPGHRKPLAALPRPHQALSNQTSPHVADLKESPDAHLNFNIIASLS